MPKSLNGTVRMSSLLPRKAMAFIGHVLKSDQVLAKPDPPRARPTRPGWRVSPPPGRRPRPSPPGASESDAESEPASVGS